MDFKERVSLFAAACEGMNKDEWEVLKQGMESRLYVTQCQAMLSNAEKLERQLQYEYCIQQRIDDEQRRKQEQMD